MEKKGDLGDNSEKRGKVQPVHITSRRRGKRYLVRKFNKTQKLAGVCYYLHDKGLQDDAKKHDVIKMYAAYMRWELPEERTVVEACVLIQKDFVLFIHWFHLNIKTEQK